jgi:hypothetical protein
VAAVYKAAFLIGRQSLEQGLAMKRYLQKAIAVTAAALSVAWLGCAGHECCRHSPYCGPGYNCYGYYSTCWRPWPEECPNCPSFAIMPPPHEELIGEEILPQPATPKN